MKPRFFAIKARLFRGRARRPRVEGTLGSIGRVICGVGFGKVEVMRPTGAAVGMGGEHADIHVSPGTGSRSVWRRVSLFSTPYCDLRPLFVFVVASSIQMGGW
ncbi:MAG TPA: hypothetical protein PLY09_08555 [Methanothrix sp.]|nr:hypothetical protein [Methanothrix sp.]